MKQPLRKLVIALFICILTFSYAAPCYATAGDNAATAGGISARLTNCTDATFNFSVTDSGAASIMVTYGGLKDVFVSAKLTVQIEKRFLGIFWRDVGDEWVAYSTDVVGLFTNTMALDGTGTYRAVFKLEIEGSTGVTDVLEDKIERTYG